MSRVAPLIPVDLNSRRILVESFASCVPRCDCCPEDEVFFESCAACFGPQREMEVVIHTFRDHTDDAWIRDLSAGVGFFHECRELTLPISDADTDDPGGRLRNRPTFLAPTQGFRVPGDGWSVAWWRTVQSSVLMRRVPERFGLGNQWATNASLNVLGISDEPGGEIDRFWFSISITHGANGFDEFGQINTFYDEGMLPPTINPCNPPIFPVSLEIDMLFGGLTATIVGFTNG